VQIVDAPQLAATIGRLFRGLREETEQALEVQTDRRARLDELVRPGDAGGDVAQILTGVEVDGRHLLRVCVLSFRTHAAQIDALVEDLAAAIDAALDAPH
jgi:hypothetical protein